MRTLLALLLLVSTARPDEFIPITDVSEFAQNVDEDDAAPTPEAEVTRVLSILPKPEVAFVDYGCGPQARWCIAAARRWGCKVVGVEIDPGRAARARLRVRELGLGHLVTIVEGDAATVDVQADVGVAYLYQTDLERIRPRVLKLRSFVSYLHQPPGLAVVKNGDSWIYTRPATAVWNGVAYSGPQCNNPNCGMCNSIRAQLATPVATPKGHWESRKFCNGRSCWYENVWIPDN